MARLGDEIDNSSTDSGDYIILKSGRKVFRKSMDDAEWSAFVADAEKQGKLKLVSESPESATKAKLLKKGAEDATVEATRKKLLKQKEIPEEEVNYLDMNTGKTRTTTRSALEKEWAEEDRKKRAPGIEVGDVERPDDEVLSSEHSGGKVTNERKVKRGELWEEERVAKELEDAGIEVGTIERKKAEPEHALFVKQKDGSIKTVKVNAAQLETAQKILGDNYVGHATKEPGEEKFTPTINKGSGGTGMNPLSIIQDMVKGAVPSGKSDISTDDVKSDTRGVEVAGNDAARRFGKKAKKSKPIQTEPEEELAPLTPLRTPEGSNPELNRQAAAQANTKYYDSATVDDPQAAPVDNTAEQVIDGMAGDVWGAVKGVGSALASGPQAVADAIVPDAPTTKYADPLDPTPGSAAAAFMPPAGAGPAPAAPGGPMSTAQAALAAGAPPPGMGGSSSSGVSMRGGAGVGVPTAAQEDILKRTVESGNAQVAQVNKLTEAQLKASDNMVAARTKFMEDQERLTSTQLAVQENSRRKQEVALQAHQEGLEAMRRASAEGIDPGRYWNNKSSGQKAAAVIAGALFGFTGKGMEWLNRLDNLVNEDVRQQEADRASRVSGLKEYAAGQLTMADRHRQLGIDESASVELQKAQKFASFGMQLENYAASVTNEQAKMNALAMRDAVLGKESAALENVSKIQQFNAGLENQRIIQWSSQRHAERMAERKAKSDGDAAKGPQAMELGGRKAVVEAVESLIKEYKDASFGGSIPAKLADKFTALIPGSDNAVYNRKRDLVIQMVGPLMGSGVLQEHELRRWSELIPSAGQIGGEEQLDNLLQEVTRAYNERLGAMEAAGHRTGMAPIKRGANLGFKAGS